MAAAVRVPYLNYNQPQPNQLNPAAIPNNFNEHVSARVQAPLNTSDGPSSVGGSWNGVLFTPKLLKDKAPEVGDVLVTFTEIKFNRTRHEGVRSYFNSNVVMPPAIGARMIRDFAAGSATGCSYVSSVGLMDLIERWNSSLSEFHSLIGDLAIQAPTADAIRGAMFNRAIGMGTAVTESALWMLMHSVMHSPEEVSKFFKLSGCLFSTNSYTKMSTVHTGGQVTLAPKYGAMACPDRSAPGMEIYLAAYRPKDRPADLAAEFCGTKLALFCASDVADAAAVIEELTDRNPDGQKTYSFIHIGTTITTNCQTVIINPHAKWFTGNSRFDHAEMVRLYHQLSTVNSYGTNLPSNRSTEFKIATRIDPMT